jgi:putative DNA primase/helicase
MLSTDIYNNIPEEFRNQDNWVGWKYEQRGNGRATKVPYQPNGHKAKSNDPSTWSTFEEVVAVSNRFDGIGWCVPITSESWYWGIDVDDAIDPDTSEFNTWENSPVQPKDIIALGSYGEITPSKAGFRVYVKSSDPVPGRCKIDFGPRNPKTDKTPGYEMYCKGRFFTFTGDQIPGTPNTVEKRTEEVKAVHAKLFPPKEQPVSQNGVIVTKGTQPTDLKDKLVYELLTGRIPETSRNNLTVGIMGALVSAGWQRPDIEEVVQLLVVAFHEDDPAYDAPATITKQLKVLDEHFKRQATGEIIAGYKFLSETLTTETIDGIRALLQGRADTDNASRVASILTAIRDHPPQSYAHQEIKYLIEPEVPKGALVLVTGAPASGKSTLVMHWALQMAEAGNEVLYLDRDNPLFIAQERIERFGPFEEPDVLGFVVER